MDEHLGERITDLARDVRVGFERQERSNDRIEAKFDKMVTQSEFNATVQRLDGQDRTIEEKVDRGLEDIRKEMHTGLDRVSNQVAEGFEAAAESNKARTSKTRWLIGASVAALGLINAVIFNIVSLLVRV